MTSAAQTIPPDAWEKMTIDQRDVDFLKNHLFEQENPLTEKELLPVLIAERIRRESQAVLDERRGDGTFYQPAGSYGAGDALVFPALDWRRGTVTAVRPGSNPDLPEFQVITVQFEDSSESLFAAGLQDHVLNRQADPSAGGPVADELQQILADHGPSLEKSLQATLQADPDLARIAGRWFPRALLVDVNIGHLNLVEAVLDEAGGKPLPVSVLLEQLDLPAGINPHLVEFSLNFALQEDGRFDEVGPAGEVLWCLQRLEPADVQTVPAALQYHPLPVDRAKSTPEMLKLEQELDDELSDLPAEPGREPITILLTYPHWRSGTLPVSGRMKALFPTAYESPRVQFTLIDAQSGAELPAWVVRQHGYVSGLKSWYAQKEVIPGSLLLVSTGPKPGSVQVQASTRRPSKEWVRTVLTGSDGGIVFATLKQNVSVNYNERMVIAVPDAEAVDQAVAKIAKTHTPFGQLVMDVFAELAKLNVQGHVHAQELYAALNVIRRCPPAPLIQFLFEQTDLTHVGDMHFRLKSGE